MLCNARLTKLDRAVLPIVHEFASKDRWFLSISEHSHRLSRTRQRNVEETALPPVSGKLSAALLFSIFQVGGIGH